MAAFAYYARGASGPAAANQRRAPFMGAPFPVPANQRAAGRLKARNSNCALCYSPLKPAQYFSKELVLNAPQRAASTTLIATATLFTIKNTLRIFCLKKSEINEENLDIFIRNRYRAECKSK